MNDNFKKVFTKADLLQFKMFTIPPVFVLLFFILCYHRKQILDRHVKVLEAQILVVYP